MSRKIGIHLGEPLVIGITQTCAFPGNADHLIFEWALSWTKDTSRRSVRLPVQWLIQGTAGLLQNICHTIQTYTGPTLVHQRLSELLAPASVFLLCSDGTFCRCILCVRETTVAILIKLFQRQNTYVHVHSACVYIYIHIYIYM